MKKIYLLVLVALCVHFYHFAPAQTNKKKVVFQAFWWDYYNYNYPASWANYLTELAPRLRQMGFDAVWIPPSSKNGGVNSVGYSPFDHYDLGDKYQKVDDYWKNQGRATTTRLGTKDELLRMIAVMHANGLEVIQDIVLNHADNAGSMTGAGGVDSNALSLQSNTGYKNFRNVSYLTPALDESRADYWSRSGRWYKNYTNYYPNQFNICCTNDINNPLFGPDISYETNAYGQSSNIPSTGSAVIGTTTRLYVNPPINTVASSDSIQSPNYMRNNARSWMVWLKKQTGVDGWRFDAVKHFPVNVQEDFIYNTKYLAGFAGGGDSMFSVGEWVGSKTELDNYINNVKTGLNPNGVANEKHTGTFDFNYRAFGSSGGIYSMVMGLGNYNMQSLPGEQQSERYMDYPTQRVHRTVPFVNNHDTYRPQLDTAAATLGNIIGWNGGSELSPHLDATEPRMPAAYAAIMAVDGNPQVFFEDLFNIQNTGKRFTHLPTSETDLPARADLINIIEAHQKLNFKDGAYAVPSSLSGADAPFYQKGSAGDHLVIERVGKAIIGITDYYNTTASNSDDQEVYVTVDASLIGKALYDYSGAHGLTTSTVFNDRRVLIKTAPVGHTITGARGHGYSIWAPAPTGVNFTSIQDLYNYLGSYMPVHTARTQQEWEMADDLGDSHCNSLMQGGRLPDNKTNQRVVGKIFVASGSQVNISVTKTNAALPLMVSLWDLDGNKLVENANGSAENLSLTNTGDKWLVIKIRNANAQAGQVCYVKADYQAPQVVAVNNVANSPKSRVAIWTGNKGTSDISDCGNWEEGVLPDSTKNLLVPAWSAPYPLIHAPTKVKNVFVEKSAMIRVMNGVMLEVAGEVKNGAIISATNF